MSLLRLKLWWARRRALPSSAFRAQLWHTLEAQLRAAQVSAPVWYRARWFRSALASIGSLLILASCATGAYAYTSPQVTIGTPLYPVKQQLESAEETLQVTPSQKAAFYLKKIDRRESEAAVLRARHEPTEATQQEIEKTVTQLRAITPELDARPDTDPILRARVHARLALHEHVLNVRGGLLEDLKTSG